MPQLIQRTFFSPTIIPGFLQDNLFRHFRQVILMVSVIFSTHASNVCVEVINKAGLNKWQVNKEDPDVKKCPLSQDFILWMSLRTQPEKHSFDDYRLFILSHADWPRIWELRDQAEKCLNTANNDEQVAYWFIRYSPRSIPAHFRFLKALENKKFHKRLKEHAKYVWQKVLISHEDRAYFIKHYSIYLNTQDHYERYRLALKKGKFQEAEQLLPQLPKTDVEAARYRLKLVSGKLPFQKLPARYQQNPKFILDYLDELKKSNPKLAIDEFIRLKGYFRMRAPFKLYMYIAREAIDLDQPEKAYRILENHPFTNKEELVAAEELLAWIACDFIKKPKTALIHLDRIRRNAIYSRTLSRAAFWTGRCYEDMKNKVEAEKWYMISSKDPLTFYGQMAHKKLGKTFNFRGWNERKPKFLADVHRREFAKLARVVSQSRFSSETSNFLYLLFIQSKSVQEKYYVMDLAMEISPSFAVKAARMLGTKQPILETKAYPVDWVMKQTDVIPSLALALIRQESSFNPHAISPAGAVGLMQIVPSTASLMAKELNIPFHETELTNPAINTKLGCRYLKKRIEEFGGHIIPAIASYNAGPIPIRRWIEKRGYPPKQHDARIRWIEQIPYEETRKYVKNVLENHTVYEHLLKIRAQKR